MHGLDNYNCGFSNYNLLQTEAGTWLCASRLSSALKYVIFINMHCVHINDSFLEEKKFSKLWK